VELSSLLVTGKITVIDFYADWCAPCRRLAPQLEALVAQDADVYLRKVDIVDWKKPVVKQYGIGSVPNVRVYDRSGRLVGRPSSSMEVIRQNIAKAKSN
jgi:thiol-disulfide isomerase/thioredoxin